jgi:hypothetical protein
MKVFISHQRADTARAATIANYLWVHHRIESYLDVVDPVIGTHAGPDLADHVREQMDSCNSLLAVVSYETAKSQWVPWEIGIATEKDFPLATFSDSILPLPEFLQKWPYLKSDADLDRYAIAVKANLGSTRIAALSRGYTAESFSKSTRTSTKDFYRTLRGYLGQ